MTEDPKKRPGPGIEGLESNLEALLGSFGKALTAAVSRLDEGKGSSDDGFDTTTGPVRATGRMRVRMGGLDSAPAAKGPRPVNRARTAAPATAADPPQTDLPKTARPLAYDLFEDDSAWILTADMPGVSADQVALSLEGGTLMLATTGPRRFEARIPQPCACPLDQVERRLVNGILTLTFPKEGSE